MAVDLGRAGPRVHIWRPVVAAKPGLGSAQASDKNRVKQLGYMRWLTKEYSDISVSITIVSNRYISRVES